MCPNQTLTQLYSSSHMFFGVSSSTLLLNDFDLVNLELSLGKIHIAFARQLPTEPELFGWTPLAFAARQRYPKYDSVIKTQIQQRIVEIVEHPEQTTLSLPFLN